MKINGFKDTIHWYDKNANNYANALKTQIFSDGIEKFIYYLHTSAKILDAGCAAGRDSAIFASKGFDVTGIDISEGLLQEAKKEYPNITFVYGDLLNLPFPDNTFDGIWANACLVHFEIINETKKAITEFNRVLSQGGILHIFVKEQLTERKTDIVSDKLSSHDRFFQYYKKEEIKNLLENCGFKIIFLENNVRDPANREDTKWIWSIAKKI